MLVRRASLRGSLGVGLPWGLGMQLALHPAPPLVAMKHLSPTLLARAMLRVVLP